MDIKKTFATDKEAEKGGVWFEIGEGGHVKIARLNNPIYRANFRKKIEPYRQAVEMGTMDDDSADKILIQVLAETIVVDWKGLTDEGENVPFTRDKAIELMTEYPDFRNFIVRNAENMNNFRLSMMEVDMGNLPAPSSGI